MLAIESASSMLYVGLPKVASKPTATRIAGSKGIPSGLISSSRWPRGRLQGVHNQGHDHNQGQVQRHRHHPDHAPGQISGHLVQLAAQIVATFNQLWGGNFSDAEQASKAIRGMSEQVANDAAYKNARMNSDKQNARIEHDAALQRLITSMVRTNTELYKQFNGNQDFQNWLSNQMFRVTYQQNTGP